MKVKNAEIWYTFTSTYEAPLYDLEMFASAILHLGITDIVYDSHGYYYKKNDKIEKYEVKVEKQPDHRSAKLNISLWPENEFERECLLQYSLNAFFEKRIFQLETNFIDHSYIKFDLGAICLENTEGTRILLYPVFTFYTSGVIVIEYRSIIDYELTLKKFIDDRVNLTFIEFDSFLLRDVFVKKTIKRKDPDNETDFEIVKTPSFNFSLMKYDIDENEQRTLTGLSKSILKDFENLLNNPLKSIRRIKNKFDFMGFWSIKPHIHILSFTGQRKLSSNNHSDYKLLFGRILSRSSCDLIHIEGLINITDLRYFEDFNLYLNEAAFLCVWSLEGIKENADFNDENNYVYIFTNQIIFRFLDYYKMLYNISAQTIMNTVSLKDILQLQETYHLLKFDSRQFFNNGELKILLEYSRRELDIASKEEVIGNLIEVKKARLEIQKNEYYNSLAVLFSLFLSIISSGTIAQELIIPLWKVIGFPLPGNYSFVSVIAWIVSAVMIVTPSIWFFIRHIRKEKMISE